MKHDGFENVDVGSSREGGIMRSRSSRSGMGYGYGGSDNRLFSNSMFQILFVHRQTHRGPKQDHSHAIIYSVVEGKGYIKVPPLACQSRKAYPTKEIQRSLRFATTWKTDSNYMCSLAK